MLKISLPNEEINCLVRNIVSFEKRLLRESSRNTQTRITFIYTEVLAYNESFNLNFQKVTFNIKLKCNESGKTI